MHDLHESLPLMYTYSGGPPQNPNLDPLLFAELPWFSNWELAQMTKWGMPGVYTHAFMDGWSPGYYASVAYNHNGLMKMYETQSGRDPVAAPAAQAPRGGAPADGAAWPRTATRSAGGAPGAGAAAARAAGDGAAAAARGEGQRAGAPPEAMRGGGPGGAPPIPTGRGGAQDREWYRGIPVPPNAAASFTRRANANYMQTGVLSSLQLASMFPTTIVENFYVKTRNSIEDGRTKAPFGFVIPVQRDMTRVAELRAHPPHPGDRGRAGHGRVQAGRRDVSGRLVRHQARPALRPPGEEPAREAGLSRHAAHHLRRQRLDDGAADARWT